MNKRILLGISLVGLGILVATILAYNYYLITLRPHFAGIDKFGIKEIYPTKAGGQEWFMNMNDPARDPRLAARDQRRPLFNKTLMAAGKFKAQRYVLEC